MSDYYYKRAILYPITKELLQEMKLEDAWEIGQYFPRDDKRFTIECFIDYTASAKSRDYKVNYYLAYELAWTYGKENSEFGRSRYLTATEQEKYVKIFEKVIHSLVPDKLKYVEYCWYNCCECDDYYIKTECVGDNRNERP